MLRLNDQNPPQPVSPGIINEKYLTVQKAAELTGYNSQYLRRLLRAGHLPGVKVGQVWLIHFDALKTYFSQAINTPDRRFGPKATQTTQPYTFVNDHCLQTYTLIEKEDQHERYDT